MTAIFLHGLIPKGTVRQANAPAHDIITCGDFDALTSVAPPNIDDLPPDGLADLALLHNGILVEYCAFAPVLPMRFGSAFSSVETAAVHLCKDAQSYLQALQTTSTFQEYAIRLTVQNDIPEICATALASGRDFLNRGRLVRDRRRNLSESRTGLARQLLTGLRDLCLQITAAGAPKPERLLDLAVLIAPGKIAALKIMAEQTVAAAAGHGLDLRITGPWPAYSFDPATPPIPELAHGA